VNHRERDANGGAVAPFRRVALRRARRAKRSRVSALSYYYFADDIAISSPRTVAQGGLARRANCANDVTNDATRALVA